MSRKKPDTYNIDTFEKLLNVVNADNAPRLAVDLGQWLVFYAHAIAKMREQNISETAGLSNCEIARSVFHWIDDGKNEFQGYTVADPNTGKVTNYKMNK